MIYYNNLTWSSKLTYNNINMPPSSPTRIQMRLMLLLLVAVVVHPPLVIGVMNGTLCPLYFAADNAIYIVNVDTTNLSSLTYRTPDLLARTPNKTSLHSTLYDYTHRYYILMI